MSDELDIVTESAASVSISSPKPTNNTQAEEFLESLLNKTLRVHTKDGRLFLGSFKCTDTKGNIVLALTYEHRHPSPKQLAAAAASAQQTTDRPVETVKASMTSRYLGMVVVPSEHIRKIELEEFASQVKGRTTNGGAAREGGAVRGVAGGGEGGGVDMDADGHGSDEAWEDVHRSILGGP